MTYYMVMIDDDDVTMVNRYVMHPTRWGIAFPPTTAPPYEERGFAKWQPALWLSAPVAAAWMIDSQVRAALLFITGAGVLVAMVTITPSKNSAT